MRTTILFFCSFLVFCTSSSQDLKIVAETWINPRDSMVYVRIPPGEIMLEVHFDTSDDSKTRNEIFTFPEGFWMAQTEVTVKQFSNFVSETGYVTQAEKNDDSFTWKEPGFIQDENHPVVYVSVSDASAYADWTGVRIPGEPEWIYACRAGTDTRFYWGDDFELQYAWIRENSVTGTRAVGLKAANQWGLFDMVGNVWEFVETCEGIIVLRGASWTRCDSARGWWGPVYGDVIYGSVRPALSLCKKTIFQPVNHDDDRGIRLVKQ